nr:hypothetical protein GTC16762_19240 [Pigmentibacter ruber]
MSRTHDKEKRERILCSGLKEFAKHSFESTTIDQIAEKAGVSKRTVYSHFDNKLALYKACVEQLLKKVSIELTEIVSNFDSLKGESWKFPVEFENLVENIEIKMLQQMLLRDGLRNREIGLYIFKEIDLPVIQKLSQSLQEKLGITSAEAQTRAVSFFGVLFYSIIVFDFLRVPADLIDFKKRDLITSLSRIFACNK